ncbi:hypothetical protein [Nocardia arizonensis]|uniref:hypothetical protein n=1 Tax=Nocardia arizonensis TaxID=1141647 RepID=UPI0012E2908C|nr:hypothetical protein [Nocardia arizonensis]
MASPDGKNKTAACASEFSFNKNAEPLGSLSRFADGAIAAAAAGTPTTLRDLARSAGWQDGFDRIVDVPQQTTAAELDRRAGTSGVCWKGLSEMSDSDYGRPRYGYYLFLNGNQPIQITPWFEPGQRPFDFRGRDQILSDTPLVGTGGKKLAPE